MKPNIDPKTVQGFGDEWTHFDQSGVESAELTRIFDQYFSIFSWEALSSEAVGFDLGCGSGRWARFVAPRVGQLHCIDASGKALEVAKRNLKEASNCIFHQASVENIPLGDGSMDFGYSLGVLHHVPDTAAGLSSCVAKLKRGAPFLVYLYYAFDNRPPWFRVLWSISDKLRSVISKLPYGLKLPITTLIAASVYFPLARCARVLELTGFNVSCFPLSSYRGLSFYTMRTDALDRFGTRLEKRFTAAQIRTMMENAGLESIAFGPREPFWCALGFRR